MEKIQMHIQRVVDKETVVHLLHGIPRSHQKNKILPSCQAPSPNYILPLNNPHEAVLAGASSWWDRESHGLPAAPASHVNAGMGPGCCSDPAPCECAWAPASLWDT